MADPVKISELPAIASVQPNDIIPVVDSLLTQTSKCTAAQIAVIGGGPPGDNTVSTDKLQNGAVTAAKTSFSQTDRILGRASAGAGAGEEIACSPYARGLLSQLTASAARSYLDALQTTNNPTFTGQVRFADGSATLPSLTNTGNEDTGFFFPFQNTVGLALEGREYVRWLPDGTTLSRTAAGGSTSTLMPAYSIRAWVVFNGTAAANYTISDPHAIAARYGWPGQSLRHDATTIAKMSADEIGFGNDIISTSTTAADGRNNYTTPFNNVHYFWNGTAWQTTGASGQSWIGSITLRSRTTTLYQSGGNVTGVVDLGVGNYRINFATLMPDNAYCALITSNKNNTQNDTGDQPMSFLAASVEVRHFEGGVPADSSMIGVAIIR